MATVKRFEDLRCWQEARGLTKAIYELTRKAPFAMDFALRDQIRKSAISIMSNIAEGLERNHNREFVYFLRVAKGSCGETQSQLYTAFDQNYIDEDTLGVMLRQAKKTSRRIGAFIRYLQLPRAAGPQPGTRNPKQTGPKFSSMTDDENEHSAPHDED